MVKCYKCGKKINFFSTKHYYEDKGKEVYLCEKCDKEFKEKEKIKKQKREKKQEKIEYKRKCKACGKVWHSLKKKEDELEKQIKKTHGASLTSAFGMMAGNWAALGASQQTKKNLQSLNKELDRLKSCPKCGSHSYTEKEVIY